MNKKKRTDLRATWSQAIITFCIPIVLLLGVRWLLFEPFVIPSGSMIPSLLIHDHIFVNKLAFGIRVPFGRKFLVQWSRPEKGQVVVFLSPENPDIFFVKRVLATGGDEISIAEGVISINGVPLTQSSLNPTQLQSFEKLLARTDSGQNFEYWMETNLKKQTYPVRYLQRELSQFNSVRVPEGSFFVIGDNRDQSSDSRRWGFVPEEYAIGTAKLVWLSCEETLISAPFICSPPTIRWDRLLKKVE